MKFDDETFKETRKNDFKVKRSPPKKVDIALTD